MGYHYIFCLCLVIITKLVKESIANQNMAFCPVNHMGVICKEQLGYKNIWCERLEAMPWGWSGGMPPPPSILKNEGHCGCLRTLFSVVHHHVH